MVLENLNWDSEFFGIKVGRIILDETDTLDPLSFKQKVAEGNFELVYIISLNKLLSPFKEEGLHFNLLDVQITMSKKFIPNEYSNVIYEYRTDLSAIELQECYRIAEQIAVVSRFYKEPLIGPEKTKELYRKWIDNAINNEHSDGIFLCRNKSEIVGIHIIKTETDSKTGYCSLIGVSEQGKRNGVGRQLWDQAYAYWKNECDIEVCKVPFSLQNIPSFNFHLKMGFNKIEETKYIYHFNTKL